MPIYEYRCSACKQKSSFFTRKVTDNFEPTCPACSGKNLARIISSFAYHKSVQTIHEESGEPSLHPGPDYYKDPRNIGRWAEKKFKEMGMEMPDELQQTIEASRQGEMPEPLKDLKSSQPDASYH